MISLLYIAKKKKKKETQGTLYTSNPFFRKITSRKQNTALHSCRNKRCYFFIL